MKIATWNVNSVKARLPHIIEYVQIEAPDILLLQETKVLDSAFPIQDIEDQGYNLAVHGQKTYNGVAILSKAPIDDVICGLDGDEADFQARYIECSVGAIRVASIYLPNGNPVDTEKFTYKLAWMRRLCSRMESLLSNEEICVFGGDYNVCPTDIDVFDPIAFKHDAVCQPEARKLFRSMIFMGLTDAIRAFHHEPGKYSYWDYRSGAWPKDNGLRIDHLLLSPKAADLLEGANIDRRPRNKKRASDHTPVWCELKD